MRKGEKPFVCHAQFSPTESVSKDHWLFFILQLIEIEYGTEFWTYGWWVDKVKIMGHKNYGSLFTDQTEIEQILSRVDSTTFGKFSEQVAGS